MAMMTTKRNIWKSLITLLNTRYDKYPEVKRQFIMVYIYDKKMKWYPYTVDSYRRILELLGYLEKIKPGLYKMIKRIPENLTLKRAKYTAYPACGEAREYWMRRLVE